MGDAKKPTAAIPGSAQVINSWCSSGSGGYLPCFEDTIAKIWLPKKYSKSDAALVSGCATSSNGVRDRKRDGDRFAADRVSKARRLCPPAVRIECASAAHLPFSKERFDLVLQSTVFTSILDPDLRRRVASEMMRVVKPDGLILWYDYHVNNPWNKMCGALATGDISAIY